MTDSTTIPPIVFDQSGFVARYPEFGALSSAQLLSYFNEAGLYCANDTCNPAFNVGVLPTLLNMVTAHIAWLNAPRDGSGVPAQVGAPASPIVGRIANATEGSVSLATQNDYPPGSAQWWQQTKYGAAYWQASASFRTMRYAANPTRVFSGIYTGRPWGW